MDSQVPNKVCYEALHAGKIVLPGMEDALTLIKGEQTYGNSRFDVYIESETKKGFIEVKGVTLESDGMVRFPDAPTERGVKHIYELIEAKKAGYNAYIRFVIQMEGVRAFGPNGETHKALGEDVREAQREGVEILVYDTKVTQESIELNLPVELIL